MTHKDVPPPDTTDEGQNTRKEELMSTAEITDTSNVPDPWTDGMSEAELDAVREYEDATAGIPDSFDGLLVGSRPEDPEEAHLWLLSLPALLSEWWDALDSLDADLGGNGIYGTPATSAARLYLDYNLDAFFRYRQELLYAIAEQTGVRVPRPDHHGGGEVETSNHSRGFFGFHDPGVQHQLAANRIR